MSFIGIDAGTTGCKTLVFSMEGKVLSKGYVEYPISRNEKGHAQLDSRSVWMKMLECIRQAVSGIPSSDPPQVISVTSMGEAVVPVTSDRKILGPSLLNIDTRGNEYLLQLEQSLSSKELFNINGNTWGNQYGATKLMWIREHEPRLYERTGYFLHWASCISFMLGSDPCVDYSLANRSLLFDVTEESWSEKLVSLCSLDIGKLPFVVPSGTVIGEVSSAAAEQTGLPKGIPIAAGAHDQCASAAGCGVVNSGDGFYGMGTFPCIMPVYQRCGNPEAMMSLGLNIEHHVLPGLFVSFIYHMGGEIVRWYRDLEQGRGIDELLSEACEGPSGLMMLPYLAPMGPPDFISDQSGLLLGLSLKTSRSDILKASIEANAMALLEVCEQLPQAGITISSLRTAGGGSSSDLTMQINSNILGVPLERPDVIEAGALGVGLIGASAAGLYASLQEAVGAVMRKGKTFEPDTRYQGIYREYFSMFKEAKSLTGDFNRRFVRMRGNSFC